MRIISRYRDYYDSATQYGVDPNIHYIRNIRSINNRYYPFPKISNRLHSLSNVYSSNKIIGKELSNWYIYDGVIGFCGDIFPFLKITVSPQNYDRDIKSKFEKYGISVPSPVGSLFEKFIYKIEHFDDFVNKFLSEQFKKEYYGDKTKYPAQFSRKFLTNSWNEVERIKEKTKEIYSKLFSYEDNKKNILCPIFTCNGKEYIYNDILRHFEFFKVKDVNTAYNEIYNYMANIAIPLKDIPPIDNETMIEIKGFDKKTSFRKTKQK